MDKLILTGGRGNIGTCFSKYMEKSHPDIEVIYLGLPFSLTKLHDILKNNDVKYFVNLAACTRDIDSYNDAYQFYETNSFGVLKQLEIIRKYSKHTRYIVGGSIYENQHLSPYASSKRISRELVQTFRSQFNLYCTQVTLAHTESKNHKTNFLARKITSKVATISKLLTSNQPFETLSLIDIDQKFYWSSSEDTCDAIWRCLNQDIYSNVMPSFPPETTNKEAFLSKHLKDYSLFSTDQHSIRSFVEIAFNSTPILDHFSSLGLVYQWLNLVDGEYYCLTGQNPEGQQIAIPLVRNVNTGVKIEQPMRFVQGSSEFCQDELGWTPKITFRQMVQEMVLEDLK